MTVASEYERRPDPEEPWRYACPECGSVNLLLHSSGTRRQDRQYTYRRPFEARRDRRPRVYCKTCESTHFEAIDRKTDSRIGADAL